MSATIDELCALIYAAQVRAGEWEVSDPNYPDLKNTISPMLCDNKNKILYITMLLFGVGMTTHPQNRDLNIVDAIYDLLGFCRAHNINVEELLMDKLKDE